MKKLFLLLSVYVVASSNILNAGIGADLKNMNRSVCNSMEQTFYGSNFITSCVALFTHNIILKKSSNLLELKDRQMVTCLTGGWIGNAISILPFIQKMPALVQVPFKHPFATCWLVYNLITNQNSITKDPANLIVGAYLALNAINECN